MGNVLDMSKYQDVTSADALCKALDLAIIRVQYGSNYVDPKYKQFVSMCKAHDQPFMHYAYGRYVSVNDAIKESDDFMHRADPEATGLVLDAEEMTTRNANDFLAATQAYINNLHKSGKLVGLYTGEYFYKAHGFNKLKNIDFLWIANYGVNDGKPHHKPSIPCDLWQYTSKGHIPGIPGNVDLNLIVGKKPLSYFTGKKPATPKPAPKPPIKETKPMPADKYFKDMGGHWSQEVVDFWAERDILHGHPDNTFRPDDPLTRGQLAAVLKSLFDKGYIIEPERTDK